jgi:ferredoxin-NADP reductase
MSCDLKFKNQKDIHLSQDKQPTSINTPTLNEKRPFTFTSLNDNDYLEFIIKIYDSNDGVTRELGKLKQGDELLIHDVWGAIEYKGEEIIAGGAGVTPFIAILRQLQAENKIANNKLFY